MALAGGAELSLAAYLGNIAAALEISYLGNLPVEAAALRRMLRLRPELHREPEDAIAAPNLLTFTTGYA